MDAILYMVTGFMAGAGAMFFFLQRRSGVLGEALESRFRLTAQEAVQQAHESFLQRAEETFKKQHAEGSHALEARQKAIDEMVKPVKTQLEGLSKALEQSGGLQKAIREDLQNLNRETAKLAGALRNPAARGNWGEEMLERLLENSGLIRGVNYEMQVTLAGARPDAVIRLPDSLHVVIDAKAPINDFVRNLDSDMDESDYKVLQTNLARAVKNHINDLGSKAYWERLNSPDFVVLFLPSEHLFSAAVQADPSLLDLAAERKVVLASPVLTMSLLRVVGMSWRQVELAKNAQEIEARGAELYKRLSAFAGHLEKIGKGIHGAMKSYNDAIGSLERSVLPSARKFRALQGQHDSADIEVAPLPEEAPRLLSLSAEDEKEKRRA